MPDLRGYKKSSYSSITILGLLTQTSLDRVTSFIKMYRFLVLIAGIVAVADAFGSGAPTTVCNDLTPKHPADPQKGPSPYIVSINKGIIHPGDNVQVILEGKDGEKFKGFIVEARVGNAIVGSFQVDPKDTEVQTINCPNGSKNAATHRNSDDKAKITVNWLAPKDLEDGVVFTATFVKDGHTFWVAQTSPKLTVRH